MGIASLSHQGKVLRFRTDPNSVTWEYNLKTNTEETYGGRVIQVLSTNIDNLRVTADAGRGGWAYIEQVAIFFRDMLFDQREGFGEPGVFRYPPRGWELKVFALNFPFKDSVEDVAREFTMAFKVQEDVSGIVTTSLIETEMAKLSKGIGFTRNAYNTPEQELVDGEYKPIPLDRSTGKGSLDDADSGDTGTDRPKATPGIPQPIGPGLPGSRPAVPSLNPQGPGL